MKAFLTDGNTREIGIGGPMIGLHFDAVMFDAYDLYKLLNMKDAELREFFSHLTTRFPPKK